MTSEQIEDIMAALSEMDIQVIEGEERDEEGVPSDDDGDSSDEVAVPEESDDDSDEATGGNVNVEVASRTDDPVRMYLREMGAVELLSREGEIAIAKRIEVGRSEMIGGLCRSPLTFNAILGWYESLQSGSMLLRDIIDLEASQSDPETENEEGMDSLENEAEDDNDGDESDASGEDGEGDGSGGDGNNLSLAALEEKLKPEIMALFAEFDTLYQKLSAMQSERIKALAEGEETSGKQKLPITRSAMSLFPLSSECICIITVLKSL